MTTRTSINVLTGHVEQVPLQAYRDRAGITTIIQDATDPAPEGMYACEFPAPAPPVVDAKLQGVLFDGVMCSATKEDMWGLASVAPWVQAGNSAAFEFDNGNVLVLTPENYREFTAVWGVFRASFFPVT